MKRTFLSIFTVLAINLILIGDISSQDTTWTQVFKYSSTTRDTMVDFPQGDHNQYEKILMYYSMRCKKGLVSTSANRNLGCGEWDYSCNTSIIDSSARDSLKATHPNFIIGGYQEEFFPYTTQPTYNIHVFPGRNITTVSGNAEVNFTPGSSLPETNFPLKNQATGKAYYVIRADELSGLSTGNLQGIRFKTNGSGTLDYTTIRMAKTNDADFNLDQITSLPYTDVVARKIDLQTGETEIWFTKPFSYTSNAHLILEVSNFGHEYRIGNTEITHVVTENTPQYVVRNDHYIQLSSQGAVKLPTTSMSSIQNEVSVSFWTRGNGNFLPNNNSIFYATDDEGNRQMNVHLPWSNSRVFWDCGFSSGSYDRIDKAASLSEYAGEWNHWVFSKNAASGNMKIYLNGSLWHSGTSKTKKIDIKNLFLGANENGELPYNGDLDDFCVWNKELDPQEIVRILTENISPGDPLYDNLLAHYDMNVFDNGQIYDRSSFKETAMFSNAPAFKRFAISEIFKGYETVSERPHMTLLRGNVIVNSVDTEIRDTVFNPPFAVTEYFVNNSDLVKGSTRYLYLANVFPVFDQNGDVIDETEFLEEGIIIVEPLTYYRKFPSKIELLSFVTPYGIGLDFGLLGKTWVFDLSDFGPVLKNRKRFIMDRGGEWQEEMDIKFAFIKGTPARPVLSIQQIWPAEAYGFTSILNNQNLETRRLKVEPDVSSMKIRTVATGHGQEGEFIPRTHSLLVNNTPFAWQLWKECADNPVYPQGGTWVYDRAGWCPGAPSDLREIEIMDLVGNNTEFNVDYGLNTASGDSRYIVNTQLVKYGQHSFINDAAIEDIISPSPADVHFRKNPVCSNPEFVLKNNGAAPLTSVAIQFGIVGGQQYNYNWSGQLAFGAKASIILPLMTTEDLWNGGRFYARVVSANGTQDEYTPNNELSTPIAQTPVLLDGIIVSMRTNGAPHETTWTLRDDAGNIIRQNRANMAANNLYNDTIVGLSGCYKLQFRDSDDDGIAWWANGDGNGMIRARGIKENNFTVFQPDFGREYTYSFVAMMSNSVKEGENEVPIAVYPNPANDKVNLKAGWGNGIGTFRITDSSGQLMANVQATSQKNSHIVSDFDVSSWKQGVYWVRYTSDSGIQTTKFVKL